MEKILLAIDGTRLNKSSLEFACYLARLTKSKLTGVFLENLVANEKPVLKTAYGAAYVDWAIDESSDEYHYKAALIEKNILLFREGCIREEVCYELHRDTGVPAYELVQESRFADVLVCDAALSFTTDEEDSPGSFVKDVLSKTECPVIIASSRIEVIDEIIFTYNGSASCLFAIKQFTYLFPQLCNKKLTILQVNEAGEWHDPDKRKLKEWLKDHYTNMHFKALEGITDSILFDAIFAGKNMFIVMGAYGRNALSQFFRRSHADILIKNIAHPVFIAHG
jgi:nucleotide-binding universal stress UspA family protein